MLTPVQRTPRYRMLLESYLKKLPENSSQRDEVLTALEFVSFAADHSNNYIKSKVIEFHKSAFSFQKCIFNVINRHCVKM